MNFKKHLLKFWNVWPPFLGSGISIREASEDYRRVLVRLKLRFWNSNYVGTQYGGSMFSMTDPFFMVMLLRNLGKEYIVWDKSASIRYIKPGKTDVFAEFIITDQDIHLIKDQVEKNGTFDWVKGVQIKDVNQVIIAEVTKTIYIRKKSSNPR